MICKISDLVVEVPASGGMAHRCEKYLTDQTLLADIIVREELYKPERHPDWRYDQLAYMMSGAQFYRQLLKFDGMLLHASAVAVDGRAYLFSGPSGMGKSTHTRLWQELLGEDAKVFNDDKPALRCLDGVWYAYGTPWCGKDGINLDLKVPLAGICFLKRGEQNAIRTLNSKEASFELIAQTIRRFKNAELLDGMLNIVERLVRDVPIYELTNRPDLDAARLSYQTMRRGAKEINL